MNAPPFWIKRVERAVEEETHIPLWGERLPFPWENLQEALAKRLSLRDLHIEPAPALFRTYEELEGDLGKEALCFTFDLAPLSVPVYWIMSGEDVRKLVSWTLTTGPDHRGFSTSIFQEGFSRFLTLQILEEIDRLNALKGISPRLARTLPLPQEGALCLDVRILYENTTLIGRIVCPRPSLHALKTHWNKEPMHWFQTARAEDISLRLHVNVGSISLTYSEWSRIGVGDGIIPDRCTLHPENHKGSCTLILHKTPLFQAKLQERSIKIVDFAFYEEIPMNKDSQEPPMEPPSEEENEEAAGEESAEHLWEATVETKEPGPLISSDEIPLTLTLELGKLEISLGALLKLQPGNALELPFHPEQGIDLVLHGKRIGRGEVLQIGDGVVVRILDLFITPQRE